jgi:hypothetical protein
VALLERLKMLKITRKDWDSEFFGKEIFSLELDDEVTTEALSQALTALDRDNAYGIEAHLNIRDLSQIQLLESLGFRLVDSRMEFITHTQRGTDPVSAEVGLFRHYDRQDWDQLVAITESNFVDNPAFQSRYNNRWIYSREESLRYYLQWHHRVVETCPDLFLSWVDGEKLVGFYSIMRQPDPENSYQKYKVALAAIDPDYRALKGQNMMQAWLFHNTPDREWTTVNSPQLTNTPGLKNNIRSGKNFVAIEVFLFRKNPALSNTDG